LWLLGLDTITVDRSIEGDSAGAKVGKIRVRPTPPGESGARGNMRQVFAKETDVDPRIEIKSTWHPSGGSERRSEVEAVRSIGSRGFGVEPRRPPGTFARSFSGPILGAILGALSPVNAHAASGDDLANRSKEILSRLASGLLETWQYDFATLGGRSISVGTLVLAILLLFVGYGVSRRLSRFVAVTMKKRFKLEAGPTSAIETLGFYFLFIAFAVTALTLVNFPLTAFTIAGGAVAIGVGFGSQNVMNNFISGLILLLERPVRVGDLVKVGETHGIVEKIGARSTRILASDNTHIIVPNSFFLENNVVNFTLSDDVLRTQVNVGVIYGSPTREVNRIIEEVLAEHPRILEFPKPRIIFSEFGDNSLNFEVYFWVRARTIMDRRQIESDLRFQIDDRFREARIVIAFPQRDVHLDSVKPLEVRVVEGESHGVS
jgi:small-conductance mechanosensitive channel